MVLYFTRFTDEIFSLLISVIFIMEATKDITGKERRSRCMADFFAFYPIAAPREETCYECVSRRERAPEWKNWSGYGEHAKMN